MSLKQILQQEKGEREIHKFLKRHPDLITSFFSHASNYSLPINEAWIGMKNRIDILLIEAHSMSWVISIVELKSIATNLFNTKGNQSYIFRSAYQQILQRKLWIKDHPTCFRESLADLLEKNDPKVPAMTRSHIYSNGIDEIRDVKTFIEYHYIMVIGRSTLMNEKDREKRLKESIGLASDIEIISYDRLIPKLQKDWNN